MTKVILLVLSYFVWLAPAIFCMLGIYYLIRQKSKIYSGAVYVSISFTLIAASVTFKQIILFSSALSTISAFIAGNSFILVSYIILTIGIMKIKNGTRRLSNSTFAYLILMIAIILYAVIENKFIIALDLAIYAAVIIIVIADIHYISNIIVKEKNKTSNLLITIFFITLIIDFILKGVTEIKGTLDGNSIKLISYSIRTVGAGILLIPATKRIRYPEKEASRIHAIVKKLAMKLSVASVLFAISFSIFAAVATYNTVGLGKVYREKYKNTIALDALNTGNSFRKLIINTGNSLESLAINPEVVNLTETGEKQLKEYYMENKDRINSVTRMDKNGTIVFTYPFTESIGQNISKQSHVKKLMQTHRSVLSDPTITVQGFPAIVLHMPVFKNSTFDGSIAVLFDMSKLSKKVIVSRYNPEKIIVSDCKHRIVFSPDEKMLFKNTATIFPINNPETFVKCALGVGIVVSEQVNVFWDKTYTVYAFIPKSFVQGNILLKILLFLLLPALFISTFFYSFKFLYDSFTEETNNLKKFGTAEYKKEKALSEKLKTLVNFSLSIDLSKNLEEIFDALLSGALKLIENGEAGSVLIKNSDKFVFTSVKGYDPIIKGKFLTKEEIVPSVTEKPFIVKRIFNRTKNSSPIKFRDEIKKLLKKIGTDRIKCTIQSPIIVDNEYYGGIFIDNFQSNDAFSEEDLQIAEFISKMGNLFLKSKNLLRQLEETERKLFTIIDGFSKIDISVGEKDFFGNLLSLSKTLIPGADGGSVTLKNGEYFDYVAIFGYNKDALSKLKLKAGDAYEIRDRKATIVKNIADYGKEKLSPEQKKLLKEAGGFRIKQSIIAPIIVKGKYYGGIFLDSFKEGEIFTQSDVEIVTALSKLSSVFTEMKIAYKELETANSLNSASLALFHKINIKSSKEEAIKSAYEVLKKIYNNKLEEAAVGEKSENKILLRKFNGEKFSLALIDKGSIEQAIKEKRSIFIDGGKKTECKEGRLQAVVYSTSPTVPIFRVRFNKKSECSEQEKEFIERFGRETVRAYQVISLYTKVKKLFINYVFSMGNAVSSYDPYTEWHSTRVAYLSMLIAEKLKLNPQQKGLLLFTAVLHDVGKIAIPKDILLKNGKLTKEEYEIIKRHPIEGEKIVKPMDPRAAKIIRHHHEKWDGTGYPDGLKDGQIPLLSRIITIADVYDALTTNRPYRKAFSFKKAIEIMISERGKAFEPGILDIFLTLPEDVLKIKQLNALKIEEMEDYLLEM